MKPSATEKTKPHDKRIDRNYQWRNPTIVDRHPEFLEFLDTKPRYVDALYERRLLLRRLERNRITTENSAGKPPRKLRDLIDREPSPRLTLVASMPIAFPETYQ